MPRARMLLLLGSWLAMPGAALAQSRSTVTSWSFGLDLSAMSAQSPASQAAVAAQCRLLTERKFGSSGATNSSSDELRELQEDCVRTFGAGTSAR